MTESKRKQAEHDGAWKERVFTVFIGAVVTITLGYMNHHTAQKAAVKVEEVSVKAEAVKTTLEESTKITDGKLDSLAKTTEATHILVNSGSLATLQLLADLSREKATRTGLPEHIKAAELAEKNVKEHQEKQKQVDARNDSRNGCWLRSPALSLAA